MAITTDLRSKRTPHYPRPHTGINLHDNRRNPTGNPVRRWIHPANQMKPRPT